MVNERETTIAATTIPLPLDRRIVPAPLAQAEIADLQQTRLLNLDQVNSPIIRTAITYWMSKQEAGAPMKRRAFDPTEIPHLLPYLLLLEVVPEGLGATAPADFRYRVIGDVMLRYSRGNYTGKCFSEVEGQGPGSEVWRICTAVAMQCRPLLACPPYVGPHHYIFYCESATMPLVDESGRPVRLLIACDFLPEPAFSHLRHLNSGHHLSKRA